MSMSWEYPVFILPHGVGYVALVDRNLPDDPSQMLVVMTELARAEGLMVEFGLPGQPRALKNAREFRWLMESVRPPITQVAFDPRPTDDQVNARWQLPIAQFIEDHLEIDFSPWNYPVFVAAQESGFACIEGQSSDGGALSALCIFSNEAKADEYLQAADEWATLCELSSLDEAIRFLKGVGDQIEAVALDPVVDEGRRTAKHCFAMETLLEKYLVRETPPDDA